MSSNPEKSTAINQQFEIIRPERKAKKIARHALKQDFTLRQKWLSDNFPATFGVMRDDPTYFGYEGPTLLDAVNVDEARLHLKPWAAETMVRGLTHLSVLPYEPVAGGKGFRATSYQSDIGWDTAEEPSVMHRSGQLTYVEATVGPDWLRPKEVGSTLSDNEHDFYGIINQLPDLLRNDEIEELVKGRSYRRNQERGWPVDYSPLGLGGAIVELDDLVLQVTALDPAQFRPFEAPGVYKKGDKYPPLDYMQDAHLVRAWRTKNN